jgi:NAD(P)-dependent dehydrogenase (short-subunit alcohol dehydrogenase family)
VTGAVRGLGLAVARRFQQGGDLVHLTWRSSESLAQEAELEFPGRVHRVNHQEGSATRNCVERILEQDGALQHVVHCVGEYHPAALTETHVDDARRMWTSNVETALHLVEAVRPHLRASRGTAVFFGCAGLEGLRARRQVAAYAAAKSALCVLVRSWAQEEGAFGVRMNLVSPGIIPHEHAAADTHDERLHDEIPLGSPGTPEDIAQACAWLSSPESAHVTGINLPVTGGWQG